MKELQIFNNDMFGEVRGLNIDGKPYAVANDIAKTLGYTNPSKATNDHCKKSKMVWGNDSLGRRQQFKVIPEGDIYRLIIKSKLPQAQDFECWVMDEVLPQIRQTGGYIPVSQEDDEKLILAKALMITKRTIEQKEQLLQQANKTIEKQKPLVDGYKQFLDVGKNMDFGTFAKHIGIGRNKIMAQLREWKVLMTDEYTVMGVKKTGDKHNQPYQKYMDKRYFIVKHKQLKTGQYKPVTLVTPRGATAIVKEFKKRDLI
ncbi:BRO family protein [Clostridium sp. 2218st1_F5_2218SCRN_220325]|uniref:BRO family protein n=1 Tax=Clostridium sp. 2218st1_F5_2218SCRN_220325 TaxID=3143056 RepID=UPI00319E9096